MNRAQLAKTSLFSIGLAEIVLIVKDILISARFYQEVVGLLPFREADDQWAWFWAGTKKTTQRIALHKGWPMFEEQAWRPFGEGWGQAHCAFTVPRDRLLAAVAHVRMQGVGVFGPIHCDWMHATSYYFYDPDGNLLEFWSPDPRSDLH